MRKKHKYQNNNSFIKLFSCCQIVNGSKRSIICDLQRNEVQLIPNILYDILKYESDKSCKQLFDFYDKSNHQILEEYIDFLIEKEYIFLTLEPNNFPQLSERWDKPSIITNTILDFSSQSNYDLKILLNQLSQLNCKAIQIRFFDEISPLYLTCILDKTENSIFTSIDIVLPFIDLFSEKVIFDISSKYLRVNSFTFTNSKLDILNNLGTYSVRFMKKVVTTHNECGNISKFNFVTNLTLFTESQKHNTCLNRKISIDVNGEIKNCPSMTKSYGNIRDTTLKEAIEKPGFKDMWFVHKDQIEVCKDCEFRHICTDCRAYIQDPNNIYSKPAKCSYDPYTATWGEDNPTNNPLHGQ